MPLTCDTYSDEDYYDYYVEPSGFTTLQTKNRRRCCSCKKLINIGNAVLKFYCWRPPKTDIENRIYGEEGEIPMASIYHCEGCGDQYMNLSALGYSMQPDEDMMLLLEEYVNSKKKKGTGVE